MKWKGKNPMGEITEMVLEGILCDQCGVLVDGEVSGYPRRCEDCGGKKILVDTI
jgi:hypothetical protein